MVSPNQVIYQINQRNDLTKTWRELTSEQKREVLKECETAKIVDAREIELIMKEVIEGQRRLF